MSSLLSLDPGKNALGWAYFGAAGLLYACGVVRAGEHEKNIALVARLVIEAVRVAISTFPPAERLVTEQMFVYPGPQKIDLNDLIALSFISGGGHILVAPHAELTLVTPSAWKGQVPKPIMQKRIEAKLSPLERQMAVASLQGVAPSLQHNGWDAVGIGLNALGRLR